MKYTLKEFSYDDDVNPQTNICAVLRLTTLRVAIVFRQVSKKRLRMNSIKNRGGIDFDEFWNQNKTTINFQCGRRPLWKVSTFFDQQLHSYI